MKYCYWTFSVRPFRKRDRRSCRNHPRTVSQVQKSSGRPEEIDSGKKSRGYDKPPVEILKLMRQNKFQDYLSSLSSIINESQKKQADKDNKNNISNSNKTSHKDEKNNTSPTSTTVAKPTTNSN